MKQPDDFMEESRTAYVKKNILYSYISTIIVSVFSFISRTVFIYTLGVGYLGVSGLFTNVLGILSFSELGIGTAINFSLYKPIAEKKDDKIKSLLHLYKMAYRVIAAVVTVVGSLLFPFLKYLLNTDIAMSEINIFYLIFLFNTISSYFVSYKTSYISAIQKNYIVTNTNTIGLTVTNFVQIIVLLMGGKYLAYLLAAAVVGLLQKIVTVIYLNYKYPILVEKDIVPLDKETKDDIWKNVRAMIFHKIGDVTVNQTDNIIISSLISTAAVGLVSNYIILSTLVSNFTGAIFASNTASIGNLIAKETQLKQKEIFEVYDFLSYWVYGFVLVAFITLSQPFITLWLGKSFLVDDLTMILFFVSKYLEGLCVVTHNFKAAGGKFNEDKWVPFAQAIINLSVSVIAVKLIGLPGIYIGTIAQRLLVNYMRPHIVYKYVLEADEREYFERFFGWILLLTCITMLMRIISRAVLTEVTILRFVIVTILTIVIPNIIIILFCYRTKEFINLKCRIIKKRV